MSEGKSGRETKDTLGRGFPAIRLGLAPPPCPESGKIRRLSLPSGAVTLRDSRPQRDDLHLPFELEVTLGDGGAGGAGGGGVVMVRVERLFPKEFNRISLIEHVTKQVLKHEFVDEVYECIRCVCFGYTHKLHCQEKLKH